MRYASIDIGTNTILMLIGDIGDSLDIKPVKDFYEVPRLGKNVSATKELAESSIDRALKVLEKYKEIAESYKVERIIASATSAVRDASNRNNFVERVKRDLGIGIEVISGEVEANVGFIGAISSSPMPNQPTLVIDIGGGSTELSYGAGLKPDLARSIDIGAVRITEKFFHENPPSPEEIAKAGEFIESELRIFPLSHLKPSVIFGVAGTATTLALIDQRKFEFDVLSVTNYIMTVEKLRKVFDIIKVKSAEEILSLTDAAKGRADVLIAGALILLKILQAANADEFLTTDRGIRYGYLVYKHKQFLRK